MMSEVDVTSALIIDPQVSLEAAKAAKELGDHIRIVTDRPLSLGAITLLNISALFRGAMPMSAQQTLIYPAH